MRNNNLFHTFITFITTNWPQTCQLHLFYYDKQNLVVQESDRMEQNYGGNLVPIRRMSETEYCTHVTHCVRMVSEPFPRQQRTDLEQCHWHKLKKAALNLHSLIEQITLNLRLNFLNQSTVPLEFSVGQFSVEVREGCVVMPEWISNRRNR